ncbi:EamA-like transporter family protein [Pseudonocardia sediminis]|uniref:EamA-like transporter family protein n=1 Tax=Pseudonocardia sediminis TaxID=1397368 RepID=A0A4Q7V0F4_PSEST|nr:EamA family transporter [Pseudonocardia sediminis]RZT86053.1 EamA-like transporter family protein [Pseudonocardia sediminis]
MSPLTLPTASPGPLVIALVLLAAVLHASWNAIAHSVPDRLVGFAMIGLVDLVGGALLAAFGGPLPAQAWPFVIASAVLHVFYNLLLLASYQLGDFSQAYPLARGTAPWLVALAAVVLLGRTLPVLELVGVLVVSAGLIALVLAAGRPGRAQLPAFGAAFATGVMIAGYTVVDGVGVGLAPVVAYTGWMFALQGPPLVVLAWWRRGRAFPAAVRRYGAAGATGGVISLAAYGIVLWAQTSGELAQIAALRETSIVFGAIIGAVVLRERFGLRRIVPSVVVLAGVIMIGLG